MKRIKETLEYYNRETNEVVKSKSHFITMPEPPFGNYEQAFKDVCNAFMDERKKSRSKQFGRAMAEVLVTRQVDEECKVVIISDSLLSYEYPQRWTYELVG